VAAGGGEFVHQVQNEGEHANSVRVCAAALGDAGLQGSVDATYLFKKPCKDFAGEFGKAAVLSPTDITVLPGRQTLVLTAPTGPAFLESHLVAAEAKDRSENQTNRDYIFEASLILSAAFIGISGLDRRARKRDEEQAAAQRR
jgi:hypothetical protein